MGEITAVKLPDLGGAQNVTVIEVLAIVGTTVELDQPLLTLEGEKATMEVPSPYAGKIISITVNVGDTVNEGDIILNMELEHAPAANLQYNKTEDNLLKEDQAEIISVLQDIELPDLGGAQNIAVIEVLVTVGDVVTIDQPLLTLEGEKATMEVPSPYAGTIESVMVQVGDIVNEADKIATITRVSVVQEELLQPEVQQQEDASAAVINPVEIVPDNSALQDNGALIYAGPSVRRLAHEFGIDLSKIKGTGPKSRLLKEDLQNYVKNIVSGSGGAGIAPIPAVDFSKFGVINTVPLSKIKRLTGEFLLRNWLNIPHVTQHAKADITELEQLRQRHKKDFIAKGSRLTLLVFVMRALVESLQKFPSFNSSLSVDNKSIIMKNYYNIGFAVDTPHGLVVPVIRNIEQKDYFEIAAEIVSLSSTARDGGLTPAQMQGGCMTISSLGGIGGEFFTPIVNAPEVAILGLSKSSMQPVYQDGKFVPRLMLPLSLSYDHRVIDGAEGARFIMYFIERLISQVAI